MGRIALRIATVALVVAAAAVWWEVWRQESTETRPKPKPVKQERAPTPRPPRMSYEEWARREFHRRHPEGEPLNWRIARTAEDYYRTQPMGKFVLQENDCSDFTDCILDEALGATARLYRRSDQHIVPDDLPLWDFFFWDPDVPLIPGDELSVRHSPHYTPYDDAPRHCGTIGTDGHVYDWTKLKRWRTDRYGRHTIEWFTRHSREPKMVIVRRLRPQYRYMIEPVPIRSEAMAAAGRPSVMEP